LLLRADFKLADSVSIRQPSDYVTCITTVYPSLRTMVLLTQNVRVGAW
jgi:hypothetical protein